MITLTNNSPLREAPAVKAAYAAITAARKEAQETTYGTPEYQEARRNLKAAEDAVNAAIRAAAKEMGLALAIPDGGQILDRANYGAIADFTVFLPDGSTKKERLKSDGKASFTWTV
jgi:hypothetical protein